VDYFDTMLPRRFAPRSSPQTPKRAKKPFFRNIKKRKFRSPRCEEDPLSASNKGQARKAIQITCFRIPYATFFLSDLVKRMTRLYSPNVVVLFVIFAVCDVLSQCTVTDAFLPKTGIQRSQFTFRLPDPPDSFLYPPIGFLREQQLFETMRGGDENSASDDIPSPSSLQNNLSANDHIGHHHHQNHQSHDATADEHHEHSSTMFHRAVHQMEHRAKEKAVLGIAERFTDGISKLAEKGLFRRFGQRTVRETGEKLTERTAERLGKRVLEHTGDRMIERGAERVLVGSAGKQLSEKVTKNAFEKLSQKFFRWSVVGRNTGRTGERFVERATERGLERIGDQVGKRMIDQTERIMEHSASKLVDRAVESSGNRMIRRSIGTNSESIFNRVGRKSFQRQTERIFGRNGRRTGEHFLTKAGDRTLIHSMASSTDRSVQRAMKVTGETLLGSRVLEKEADRIVVRLTKGLMIALPAIGGLFALYLFKTDVDRFNEERPHRVLPSLALFAGASIADLSDTILHFCIFAGLLMHWSHHRLEVIEKMSIGCAIVSTLCMVVGEIVSYGIRKRKTQTTGMVAYETP